MKFRTLLHPLLCAQTLRPLLLIPTFLFFNAPLRRGGGGEFFSPASKRRNPAQV